MATGESVACTRTLRLAADVSVLAAGYEGGLVGAAASTTNSSSDGPTIGEPSGFVATGTVIERAAGPGATVTSQPLQAMTYPRRMRKPSPASADVVGSLPRKMPVSVSMTAVESFRP